MARKIFAIAALSVQLMCGVVFFQAILPDDAKAQSAEALLARDLLAGVKTLAKDVRIYHYFNLAQVYDELKTPSGRAAFTSRYIEQVTARFWDLSFHADAYINAGPGLYLAIDPLISSKPPNYFGNTMIELAVPAGTKYLNVVRAIPLAKDTLEALVGEGYFARHQLGSFFSKAAGASRLGFYRDTLKTMTDPGYEKFRSLVQRILTANHIQFIEYNWNTSLAGFCNKTSYSAFNYIGSSPYNGMFRNLAMLSQLSFPEPTAAEQEIAARVTKFRDVLEQIDQMKKRGVKIPKDFALGFYTPAELKQIKDMSFSCE